MPRRRRSTTRRRRSTQTAQGCASLLALIVAAAFGALKLLEMIGNGMLASARWLALWDHRRTLRKSDPGTAASQTSASPSRASWVRAWLIVAAGVVLVGVGCSALINTAEAVSR